MRRPGLPARKVIVGGVTVSYAQAVDAGEILAASRTSAIAPVLRAAGHPLAIADYFGFAAPYLAQAKKAPLTGRSGAAGRHVTKNAFLAHLDAVLTEAGDRELAVTLAAFRTDERYAAEIARAAVELRRKAHSAGLRSAIRAAAAGALAQCAAAAGTFTCGESSACGTGSCRFAPAAYAGLDVPATGGRLARPANHEQAGRGFSEQAAVAEAVSRIPVAAGVPVSDTETCHGSDGIAA
jgi:hypothetical protein